MKRLHRFLFVPLVAAVSLVATACEDGTTTQSGTESSISTIRDQLQQAVDTVVSSCQDRDRDRLRDLVQDQLRDRVRDMDMLGVCDGSGLEATIDELNVDGDTATVQVRLRIRAENGEASELRETWRFRWEKDRWLLAELPAAVTATTPSTIRDQDQTQDKDRGTS